MAFSKEDQAHITAHNKQRSVFIPFTDEDWDDAMALAMIRRGAHTTDQARNQRLDENSPYAEDFVGASGEKAMFMLHPAFVLDRKERRHGDQGIDHVVGKMTIDIKTTDQLWNRKLLVKKGYVGANIYVLAAKQPEGVYLIGWESKDIVMQQPIELTNENTLRYWNHFVLPHNLVPMPALLTLLGLNQ